VNVEVVTPFGIICAACRVGYDNVNSNQAEAVFGQANFHATEKLTFIAGARYQHQELTDFNINKVNRNLIVRGSADETNMSGRVAFKYDLNEDTMAYGSVATGYKGPQVNNSDPARPGRLVRAEKPISYEVGLKATILDNRLALDFNVFYSAVKDYQAQDCQQVPTGLACGPINADVVSKGVEIDFFGQPLPGLTVNGGVIYNPVKWPSGTTAEDTGLPVGGRQLNNSPEWKLVLGGEYERELTGGLNGFVAVDGVYRTDTNLYRSVNPIFTYPAHWIVGGRVGVRSGDGRWEAALFGRNLGDEPEPSLLFPFNTFDVSTSLGPNSLRLVGVALSARF